MEYIPFLNERNLCPSQACREAPARAPASACRLLLASSVLATALSVAASSGRAQEAANLSNSEAKELLEDEWSDSCWSVPLGELRVMRATFVGSETPQWVGKDRILTPTTLQMLFFLDDAEIVQVRSEELVDKQQDSFSWDDFGKQTRGAVGTATITRNPKASELYIREENESSGGYVCVGIGEFYVEEIIDNTVITRDATTYHLVRGFHSAEQPDWFPTFVERSNDLLSGAYDDVLTTRERKFRALLEYDVFDETWSVAALDEAPRAGDFSKDDVSEILDN